MAGAEENGKREQCLNGFSRDLLTKFRSGDESWRFSHAREGVDKEDEELEIELSLGLSSNGRFGVDPKRPKQKILRSSSIASFMMLGSGGDEAGRDAHAGAGECEGHAPLLRTSSLPTPSAAEEELRKRKEIQTLRRMEAKRKRMERKNVVRAVREKIDVVVEVANGCGGGGNGISVINGHAQGQYGNGLAASSQGSLGSQGTGSSGISDLESQPPQGTSKATEERSPSSVQSRLEQQVECNNNRKTMAEKLNGAGAGAGATGGDKEAKNTKDLLRNGMMDMPCVSTRGDGPNGKKIEGFLYRYQKGEEVKIVCVCHGNFFTPAEFVKHAGGSDVAHPLRHIVVDPSPLL